MTEAMPITILAMPKPFHDHIGIIQRNAITELDDAAPASGDLSLR